MPPSMPPSEAVSLTQAALVNNNMGAQGAAGAHVMGMGGIKGSGAMPLSNQQLQEPLPT